MVQKPEWIDFLQLLPAKDHYYWVAPSLPRARAVAELQAAAAELGLVGLAWPSVADGLAAAKAAAAPSDLIIVTGSTFVVADALDYLEPLEQ
jgi:dihydrofolate synthase/folylpolyglutamate synthase